MPKTLTKPRSMSGSIAADNSDPLADLTATAVSRWREWATAIADGEQLAAEPREIMDVANVLAIRDPSATLHADANVLAQVRASEARVAAERKAWQAEVAAYGGAAGIQSKIKELRDEIRKLEAINGPGRAMASGYTAGEIVGTRNRNPRLFNKTYQGEGR
jgi:hypothetical protein